MASMNSRAKEVIAELDQFESDMNLTNKWVHGDESMTVLLGGVRTPSIRNLVKNFRLSAQEILNAAEYIQDNFDGLEDIIDANREYAEIAGLLMLKIADWMARDLAIMNQMNIDIYNWWYKHGIECIGNVGRDAEQFVQNVSDLIDAFDESCAQRRLQIRLFDGTNPASSSKPVLFIVSGQSNAVGSGDYEPFDRAVDCGQFWDWRLSGSGFSWTCTGSLKPIADPIVWAGKGSGWCAFARRFFAITGRKVLMINWAKGGSAVTDGGYTTADTWADNGYGTLRASRQAIWDAFSAAVPASSYDVGGFLWDQGGTDEGRVLAGTVTFDDYIDATYDVWNWHRTLVGDADAMVLFALTEYNTASLSSEYMFQHRTKLINAQKAMCADPSINAHIGFSLVTEFWRDVDFYMSPDGSHYNRRGYRLQGEALARSAVHYLGI